MKRFFSLLICGGLLFGLAACGSDSTDGEGGGSGSLALSTAKLELSAEGQTSTLDITASGSWTAEVAKDVKWCSVDKRSGSGNYQLKVIVSANVKEERRQTTITVKSGGDKQVVDVIQGTNADIPVEDVAFEKSEWDGEKRADLSYQVLVYTFADSNGDGVGDFNGITQKLDYFDELGVSALWLSPIHPAASYHGYDVKDYDAVNPQYGTKADLQNLIDRAHERNIRIYLDYVINHTSKEHPWFLAAKADETSPYRDYYVLSSDPAADIAAGKIDQIATEGSNGYDSNQWYPAVSGGAKSVKVKFTLQWGATPTLMIEKVDVIENTGTPVSDRFLYAGDPGKEIAFYSQGNDLYTLSLELTSMWGCLVRTSTDSTWPKGTKYGSKAPDNQLAWGVPLPIYPSSNSFDPGDILLPGMEVLMYHSHFWTDWFVDLDYGKASQCAESPAFKAIVASAEKWIDMGVDGLRMDGAKHIYHNAGSDENPTFWNTFYTTLDTYFKSKRGADKKFYMVGEVYSGSGEVAKYYKGLPACFEFDFYWRLKDCLNNGVGNYFVKDLLSYREKYAANRTDYIAATKLTNHDENRACSELGESTARAKQAGAVLLTAHGSPYIYYGEELGYVGIKDGKGDEYVRCPLKWGDNYTTTTIYMDKVDAGMAKVKDIAAQSADANSILSVYRTFGQLRNTYPALATGTMEKHATYNERASGDNAAIAAWYRTSGDERMLVVHNFAGAEREVALTDEIEKGVASLGSVKAGSKSGKTTVTMGANSSVVFLLKQ